MATLLDVDKLAWLHIPKAGTSFANTLVTWGCPDLSDSCQLEGNGDPNAALIPPFMEAHKKECKEGFTLCGGHRAVGSPCLTLKNHSGHFVAMFRQPEQRTISGFHHDLHDYEGHKTANTSISEYATALAGCTTRMILGHACGNPFHIDEPKMDKALQVLEREFAFVGLTEEFDLSVCLFHKMFGGSCHRREFLNIRPGTYHDEQGYDAAGILNGFKDEIDGKLYANAKRIFWSNVNKFGVHRASCEQICKNFPDPFLRKDRNSAAAHEHAEYDWPERPAYEED